MERIAMKINVSHGRRCILLAIAAIAVMAAVERGGDAREVREYTVHVDGKPAGHARIAIEARDDGTTEVSCETEVRVRFLIFKYRYSFQGREVWKAGRLESLTSRSDDDGKKYELTAVGAEEDLRVTVNGRTSRAPADAWTTSCWQLPPEKRRRGSIPLLDVDTGQQFEGRLQYRGVEEIAAGGETMKVRRYRLTGRVAMDLWFDDADRLVKQDWLEEGHRTVVLLAAVRR
jgi:hypothetical protein